MQRSFLHACLAFSLALPAAALACGLHHAHQHGAQPDAAAATDPAAETAFAEPIQLTSEAQFARAGEAYFSPDSRWIIFQAVPHEEENADPGAPPVYSMFVAKLRRDADTGAVLGMHEPIRISAPGSANTCGWFHPSLPGVVLFGSTLEAPASVAEAGYSRDTSRYTWEFPEEMEIVTRTIREIVEDTVADQRLRAELLARPDLDLAVPMFTEPGYDAEGSWSPDGRFVLYTHVDPETQDGDLYMRHIAAGVSYPIVVADGYDGGPFFSPDGRWICYRSDRNDDNLLQVFIAELDFDERGVPVGIKREIQLTDNQHVNWAPFWHPSGDYLVYATSEVSHRNYEVFAVPAARSTPDDELETVRLTHAEGFDGLPVFNPDGSLLMWTGQRMQPGSDGRRSSQLYLAEYNGSYPAGLGPLRPIRSGELGPADTPLAGAMAHLSPQARAFYTHVTTLASDWMVGRLPGTDGIEFAERYIADAFAAAGLTPIIGPDGTPSNDDASAYFHPFTFAAGRSGPHVAAEEARSDESAAPAEVAAHNVVGLLPGRGADADRYIVIGAHHDHLGRGRVGSMAMPGDVHNGADDNASGVAAVLLLADRLAAAYRDLPADADARSIAFVTFSAEEQGLNGSRAFVRNGPIDHDDIDLMLNFDMVGRITGGRLSVAGLDTATELAGLAQPLFDASPLTITHPPGLTARSDHAAFYDAGVPVLFFTIDPFHSDYHTPADDSWKLNAHGASLAVDLAAELTLAASTHAAGFTFSEVEAAESTGPAPALGDIRVRFGIMPGNYNDPEPGVLVQRVSPDASADLAGIRAGDRLMAWNGRPMTDIRTWMTYMGEHQPGDVVTVTVRRDGERIDLPVTLQASKR